MREKAVRCYTSAADVMRAPEGFMASPAFAHQRWTIHAEQRDERIRLFARKLLRRLDGLNMPFRATVGLMNYAEAQHRYVTGRDPWLPMENPFFDGVAIRFAHCLLEGGMDPKCWSLFGEIGFDVARLAQIPVMWGGFNDPHNLPPDPGFWQVYDGVTPDGMYVDRRTYGYRKGPAAPSRVFEAV